MLRSGLILGLLGLAGTAQAEPANTPPLDGQDLARAQEASHELVRAVEHLQSDIVQELGGIQDRAFYHVVDPVLHLDQAHQVDQLLDELHQWLGITTQRTRLAGRP
jgi:hypothetical protein